MTERAMIVLPRAYGVYRPVSCPRVDVQRMPIRPDDPRDDQVYSIVYSWPDDRNSRPIQLQVRVPTDLFRPNAVREFFSWLWSDVTRKVQATSDGTARTSRYVQSALSEQARTSLGQTLDALYQMRR